MHTMAPRRTLSLLRWRCRRLFIRLCPRWTELCTRYLCLLSVEHTSVDHRTTTSIIHRTLQQPTTSLSPGQRQRRTKAYNSAPPPPPQRPPSSLPPRIALHTGALFLLKAGGLRSVFLAAWSLDPRSVTDQAAAAGRSAASRIKNFQFTCGQPRVSDPAFFYLARAGAGEGSKCVP